MTTDELKKYLKGMTLLSDVAEIHIDKIIKNLKEEKFTANKKIFLDGSKGEYVYMIVKGSINISKQTKHNVESVLGILHTGDFFGELEILDGLPRSATATAITESNLIRIDKEDFNYLLENSNAFANNILKTLASRLRTIDETFVKELDHYIDSIHNRLEKLHQLVEATKIVNSTLDIDKLLSLIMDIAVQTVNADRGTLYLIDEIKKELWSKVLQGTELIEIRLPIGKGIAGTVAETGETINISEAYKDSRFNPEIDKISGYQTNSILCMPMKNKDEKIVGVFQLLNKNNGNFTGEDENYISAFSIHASLAIENANLAQQMVQNERLSAVGRMASTIIHDIKNPLGTIRLTAQVLKRKTAREDEVKLIDAIIKQIDRFVAMTQEILDFSKGVSVTTLQEVDTENLIEDVLFLIEKDFSKRNIEIIKNISYKGKCILDPDKITRVFINISGNAADAMPDGGILKINVFSEDNNVVFEFVDSGIGMSDEIKSKIFEPFFTRGKQHGTGLGMAIVKKIIDDHKGNIEIESEIGKGTSIKIKIPKTQN